MSVKVKSYHTQSLDQESPVLGFVSFYIPEWGLHLNNCKHIRNKNGGYFIGFPSKEIQKDEKKEFFPYFYFEKKVNHKFQESALKAIEEYKNNTKDLDSDDYF